MIIKFIKCIITSYFIFYYLVFHDGNGIEKSWQQSRNQGSHRLEKYLNLEGFLENVCLFALILYVH